MLRRTLGLPLLLVPLLLLAACGGSEGERGKGLYMALGDSITAGRGVENAATDGFVGRVHRQLGQGFLLLNLGHSGDTSAQIRNDGQVERAVAEITSRNTDAATDNDVRYVTLTIGGNDLLDLFFPLVLGGRCTSVADALDKAECRDPLSAAVVELRANVAATLAALHAAGPSVEVIVITLYNPFSAVPIAQGIGALALEGLPNTPFADGANDILRQEAAKTGARVAEVYALFEEKPGRLIAEDRIHPNLEGHRLIADAVIKAIDSAE